MIDLHTHTTASDGSFSPVELMETAAREEIHTLGITDHDTFAGYDEAANHAYRLGIRLVCGIEISTKLQGRSVHLLAYYPDGCPTAAREWISGMQASRNQRNIDLVKLLQANGFDISLDEVHAKGRNMTGRPHFAQVLRDKGYVASIQEAFDKYLDKSAPCYVDRDEPQFTSCLQKVSEHRGVTSLAHPYRVNLDLDKILPELRAHGLHALEVYHSDHTTAQTKRLFELAEQYGFGKTGGSDFHGALKPEIKLGTGRDKTLKIPLTLLDCLR